MKKVCSTTNLSNQLVKVKGGGRGKNYINNKAREDIVLFLIQKQCQSKPDPKLTQKIHKSIGNPLFPEVYGRFEYGLNHCLDFKKLFQDPLDYKAVGRGGRKYHYDFYITGTEKETPNKIQKEIKLEFKYGAKTISSCPQWVSPHQPSRYFDMSFEEFHYHNYLPQIMKLLDVEMPSLTTYLSEVHQPEPPCMKSAQAKYYLGAKGSSRFSGKEQDIKCYQQVKKLSENSISQFLSKAKLQIDILNHYLQDSQESKTYLLWDSDTKQFHVEKPSMDDYTIQSLENTSWRGHTIRGTTVSGHPIQIMLRWKNGNGIAYPAFQIK